MTKEFDFETAAIRIGANKTHNNEHSSPLFLTSSFVFNDAENARALFDNEVDGYVYSRYSNPSLVELNQKICALEGTEAAISTASGMSAMTLSMLSFLKAGDHVITSRALFASTHQLLTKLFPRWGIQHSYVNLNNTEELEKATTEKTKLIFLETPSNPCLEILDLQMIGDYCKSRNLLFVVDNCFATPYLQKPAQFGADIIAHSGTKFIDGQGRVLGGLLTGRKELIDEASVLYKQMGPAMSPFNAWVLSKSLETLAIRMEAHCKSALKLAQFLESHSEIKQVYYPFLESHPQYELAKKQMKLGGGVVSFRIKGGAERSIQFHDQVQWLSKSSNLGDSRTILTYPRYTTHSSLSAEERTAINITDDTFRVSVGLESINDIIADLNQALNTTA